MATFDMKMQVVSSPSQAEKPEVSLDRRDVGCGRILASERTKACIEHPDYPGDSCPECQGYEVRRG